MDGFILMTKTNNELVCINVRHILAFWRSGQAQYNDNTVFYTAIRLVGDPPDEHILVIESIDDVYDAISKTDLRKQMGKLLGVQ